MIMVCQGRNIPLLFSSIEPLFPTKSLCVAIFLCLSTLPTCAEAGEYFNPNLLEVTANSATSVDLSYFSQDGVPPGTYYLDVFINDKYVGSESLLFQVNNPDAGANATVTPCLSTEFLHSWLINTAAYPKLFEAGETCAQLSAIPGVTFTVSLAQQRIDFTVPQAAMLNRPRDYVPESQWQQGINAGILNYSISGQRNTPRHNGATIDSQFISLQPGVNLGPWRLRNYSTYSHSDNSSRWESVYSYITSDIQTLRSQLVVGNTYTSSGIFDSMSFTGLQLSSDKEMLPDSLHGFAPTIKGIARTTAEVSVYQNGYSIYKTTVAPGAFEIKDLYATGSAGDLYVSIKESDGSEQNFVVPFASLAILQREGQLDYALSSGRTRSGSSDDKEYNFIQSSLVYGVTSNVTLYSGFQQAEDKYTNLLLGAGFNLGTIGALSFDGSQSWADVNANAAATSTSKEQGQSYRVRFSKSFLQTGTNFSVAGYRYSTAGYYSFQDFVDNASTQYDCCTSNGRTKGRFDASVSQTLFGYGSLSLSLINETYWDNSRMASVGVGYSGAIGKASYFINYSYNRNVQNTDDSGHNRPASDTVVSLTLSIPLGDSLSANYTMNHGRHNDTTHSVGLNGSAFEDRSLNWSVLEGYNTQDKSTSGNLSVNYQGAKGDVAGGYGYDRYSNHYNYSLRGGMVAHSGGLTLSRFLGESSALVETPGVSDVTVRGQTNVTTDATGYAVVPYVRPYHRNSLALDEQEIPGAEVDNVARTVVPTRNAIVKVQYDTRIGYKAMLTLRTRSGVVPFGALVTLDNARPNTSVSRSNIVGDEGQVYLTGLQKKGQLLARWGDKSSEQCTAHYDFSSTTLSDNIQFYQAICR
ncbi:TPA: fimbrial biogenesis outer membrane usher protein [Klebsiella quasipneumoniae subsp. quasipneumoniae]|nr:fimbrial biogenesis outer membrane usher protein [Klebsiella quasipneumoniae subsp. quasipneumoniae]HCI6988658.1 fimbrial biogenesis outer membrane usher protein [Klebsiella quasipneumoniae subsp. quasipneumoniae]